MSGEWTVEGRERMEQPEHDRRHTLGIREEADAHTPGSGPGLCVLLAPFPRPVQSGNHPAGWPQRR